MTQALVKKFLFFSILLLLLTFNFQLSTHAQETPFPTEHLQLWLRADSVELTNGKVSRWYDLSHNNYVIQQSTNSAKPWKYDSSINGLPTIVFKGNQQLSGTESFSFDNLNWTFFAVARTYKKTNAEQLIIGNGATGGGSNRYRLDIDRFATTNASPAEISFSSYIHDSTFCIYSLDYIDNSAHSNIYINGFNSAHIDYSSAMGHNNGKLKIGAYSSPSESALNGEIAEIIAFDTISDNLRNIVIDYLYDKYISIVSLGLDIHIPYGFCDTAITTAYNPDFISYQWSTGETDSIIHVNRSGRYTVTVTNSFGVTSTDDINVYFPEHFQLQDTTICDGDAIFWNTGLDDDGYTFQWIKDGIQYADASNQIEIFENGRYTCIITDSIGCNFQTDTLYIGIDHYPISTSFMTYGTSSVHTDTAMCSGNSLGLATNISETTSYIWNTGATSSRIIIAESGNYSLTTTNNRGCRATNSIQVNIQGEAPEINYAIYNLCHGDSTSFICNAQSLQGIESYLWIIDDTDSIESGILNYKFATAGAHTIRTIVTSNNTCRTDSSFNINIKEIPYPNFTYTPVCAGIPMNFIGDNTIPDGTSIESYTWLINDSIIGTNENLTFSTDYAGIIQLKYMLSLSNGCQSDTTINISISNEYSEPRYVSPAYPTNGMLVSSDSITFSWNYDYDILYYNLIISPSADFSNADTIACSTNSITLPSETFADTAYWKVTSYNHCLLSLESEPYIFRKTIVNNDFFASNPNLQLWLRADSVELTNGKVSRWYDLSHNNYVIQQSTNSAKPWKYDSSINGLPTIVFKGNQQLSGTESFSFDNLNWTFFAVARTYKKTNAEQLIIGNGATGGGSNRYRLDIDRFATTNASPAEISFSSYIHDSTFCIYSLDYIDNSAHSNIYINGFNSAHIDYSSAMGHNNGKLKIGAYSSPSESALNGEIAEIIAFDTISDNLRNIVIDYLYDKYISIVSLGLDIHTTSFCDTAITTAYNPDFISYQWNTGETDSVIHVNRSGKYTVTVTNSFGVTSTDDINVYFPEHNRLQDTTICAGDTIYWNLKMRQDEYSFQWFKDSAQLYNTSNHIEIFEAGAYTCIITDSIGCSFQTDTMHLAIDNYPISAGFENSDTTLCYGNRLHIASNYEETASAIWNDGTTDIEHYLTQPGTYTVTTTNNRGCQAINTINVNLQGQVPMPNFSIEGHCQNIPINIIDLSTSEIGNISTHRWFANDSLIGTDANASHIFTEYGQQNIKLYLETTDNCANDTTISVYIDPQPQPDFTPKFFCQNALTEIHTQSSIAEGNVTAHSWIINGEPQTGDNITAMFSNNGINTITLSAESEFGCVSTKTFEVNVQQADMPSIGISGICVGQETEFINKTPFNNINPQTAWEWNFGDESELSTSRNAVHTYDSIGTYDISLAVTYANRCTTSIDTTITIHELPDASISTHTGCIGSETMLEAEISSSDNIAEYNWQIDSIFISREAQPTFVADTTGTFAVTLDIKTEYACSSQTTDSITIYENPNIMFTQSRDWGGNPLFVEFENMSNGAMSYHWDFGGMGESTQPNPYFIFTAPGTYNVTLAGTSPDGCTSRYTSTAITVVEPIVDIMLMDLKTTIENSFAKVSFVIVNLGTLPVEDLVLELRFNDRTLRESIDYIAQGEVRPYTFGTQMPVPQSNDIKSTICVEAIVPDTEGHSDTNLTNNILCITDAENLSVGIPYPIPASEQITCDIYTKIPTDLDISIFNIFGKLVKHETISQHKGYLKYVVNVMDLASGMYFIRVNSKDESITHKFEIR